MALESMQEIFDKIEKTNKPFWRVVLDTDMEEREVTEAASMERMRFTWQAMLESVESYQGERRSVSGLVGGDGARMRDYAAKEKPLSGDYLAEVIATALSVGESNACMCKIVAAPTAGACGVLPAVLVPLYKQGNIEEEDILKALYVASGIGAVIAFRACIAGAAGGCQAEIGSASAMASMAMGASMGADDADSDLLPQPPSRPSTSTRASSQAQLLLFIQNASFAPPSSFGGHLFFRRGLLEKVPPGPKNAPTFLPAVAFFLRPL